MEIGWGKPISTQIQGLDVLGVRGLDQSIEEKLVNGITTVSWRARYFSLLPWAIGEFFEREQQIAGGSYDEDAFVRFVSRVELLTLAATAADSLNPDAGRGLGGDRYVNELRQLPSGSTVAFPLDAGEGLVNAYRGPCRALGILGVGDENGGNPHRLSPRGQAIWRARKSSVPREIVQQLLDGGSFDKALALAAVGDFSLNAIATNPKELACLTTAFTEPWTPSDGDRESVAAAYGRFAETMEWVQSWGRGRSIGGLALLATNYADVMKNPPGETIRIQWAEYEWRRRVHYALELLLSAFGGALFSRSGASVAEVLGDWAQELVAPQLSSWWPAAGDAWPNDAARVKSSVPEGLFEDQAIPVAMLNRLPDGSKALAGYALLVALGRQSQTSRTSARFPDRESAGEQALKIVGSETDKTFPATMAALFEDCVVPAHLMTTFRKMSEGADCSLRFYPDGERLRSTGANPGAGVGQSGPRLLNVCRILTDMGLLDFTDELDVTEPETVQ